jgi:AbrB family looped-hinge helix DNA binding protein
MKSLILTVSPQGQITLPKQWRESFQLKKGAQILAWIEKKVKTNVIYLMPQPKSWIQAVKGSSKGLWGDSDAYIQKERNQWTRKS